MVAEPSTQPPFRRGDVNDDGAVDISDPTVILNWLFLGGERPSCLDAANTNGDRAHDLSDAVTLLNYLFAGGEPPPAPGPKLCGADPAPVFGCERAVACPVR